ncbi:MAG: hypothetical protein CL908_18980 [Deltaproteobacteria bacterium]|nr:hypothetical protein [Deltaproteobacteria bacterium]
MSPRQGLPLHTRSLTVAISRRPDGRWRARGDVIDLRKNGFIPSSHDLQPSGVIHMMSIELSLAPSSLRLDEITIEQPFVAVEASPATGGECCRDPAPRLLAMKGELLDDGFTKRLGTRFGGALGCSHLLTLFQLMASTIPRALQLEAERAEREGTTHREDRRFFRRAIFVDGHERDPSTTDVSIQLADTHTRPIAEGTPLTSQLEASFEVKTFASVDRKHFRIEELESRERHRTFETIASAPWTHHDALVSPLVGHPVIRGMAARVFELLGKGPKNALLRDNLLQFAPGFIQITGAQLDDYFEKRAQTTKPGPMQKPAVTSLGGRPNSCYMWREDSLVARALARDKTGRESG